KRRVASRENLPGEAKSLVDKFVSQRILVANANSVEVAHEAILRQWPLLARWIDEDRRALSVLNGIRVAAMEWSENNAQENQKSKAWLVHQGERLREAKRVL